MKRATYKDISSWFSLDTYDYLLDLSVRHVIAEVFMMGHNVASLSYRKVEQFKTIPFPMVGDITLFEEELRDNQLSGDDRGILLQNFAILCAFVNSCLADGRIGISPTGLLEPREDIAHHDIYNQPMLYEAGDPKSEGYTGLFVDVSLDLMSDEEMLASFKILLKKWRKQTGIKEPSSDDRRRFGTSTIAKIYQYKIIPYLDITRWAKINDLTVSNEVFARLLFPEPLPSGEIKGGSHIRDSVKPFAESARELLNSAALKKYYANNPHIENMRFSEFLKLSEFQ
ncbi:DUF6387 family protein [Enterobacter cancerogenus]|uniref:DUF6387 family protein n=1 Tax=Enterobacter cancerogenus TaxID=69218 RepID=UPI004058237B